MIWKKSDNPIAESATRASAAAWRAAIAANAWIPVALAVLVWLSRYVENPDRANAYYFRIICHVGIYIILAVSLQLINGISGQFSLGHAGFMAVGSYLAGYAVLTYGSIGQGDNQMDFANPGPVAAYFLALGGSLLLGALVLLAIFLLLRASRRWFAQAPALLVLLCFGWMLADITIAWRSGSAAWYLPWSELIASLGRLFDLLLHTAGPLSRIFGRFTPEHRAPITLLIALVGAGVTAGAAGLVVGLPTLRLRGDYLAIATLGFAQIICVVIVNSQALGGATGMSGVPTYHLENDDRVPIRFIFPWIAGTALITFVAIRRLARSPKGLALAAVREDEVAAAATGIDTTHHKVLAFVIGAFFAGTAGALFAFHEGYLNTNDFGFMNSVELVVMVTLGGLGSLWGAVIAAAMLTILKELLRDPAASLPKNLHTLVPPAKWVGENRLVVYAALLIAIMILRAQPWSKFSYWKSRFVEG